MEQSLKNLTLISEPEKKEPKEPIVSTISMDNIRKPNLDKWGVGKVEGKSFADAMKK